MKVKKFEYLIQQKNYSDFVTEFDTLLESQERYLNERGAEGWELVNIVPIFEKTITVLTKTYRFYFKRRIE